LREFLMSARQYPDVWFCRRRDIADFWRNKFPAAR